MFQSVDVSGKRVGNVLCKVPSAYCYLWQKEVSGLLVKTEGRDAWKRRESYVSGRTEDVDDMEDASHTVCASLCI